MAIKPYLKDEKRLYEVYVAARNVKGKRIQYRRQGVETLNEARQIEFELKRKIAEFKEAKVGHLWADWYEECLNRMRVSYRPSTVHGYQMQVGYRVNPHWVGKKLTEITRAEVHSTLFEKIGADLSPNSRKTMLKQVRRLFMMAVEEGILDRNPCNGIRVHVPEVEQKVLTNTEVGVFLTESKAVNHRFYPIWALALMTGMRSGELYALKWTDIDWDSKTLSVQRQWTRLCGYGPTKTQKSRVVPISDDLLKFLKELKLKRGAEDEFVLPHLPEWEVGAQATITQDFCQAVRITPVKFHDLRATFITNLLARGESLARVMAIVGHSQLKTTNLYLRKAGVDVQGGTDKLGYKLPEERIGAKIISFAQNSNDKSGE